MKKDISTTLRKSGLKVTPTRLSVLGIFSNDCKPINAEYIFKKLLSKKINLVTIYRTLSTFREKEILRTVNINNDSVHYELAKHHHHHLICRDCGDIEDINICNKSLDTEALSQSKKFKLIQNHSVEFFGICKKCES